ncbi:MAG: metallophosphoesterase family protein [Polyangiaceae bacterium]
MSLTFSTDSKVAEQQMHAIIFYLTAFGYVDGDFDASEKKFIQDYIGKLVEKRARDVLGPSGGSLPHELIQKWTGHFHEVLDEIDNSIQTHFTEVVADGEDPKQFVIAKLKLRCYELFKKFDEQNRVGLLMCVDELMHADGVVHPSEARFRAELQSLLYAPLELDDSEIEEVKEEAVVIDSARSIAPREENHPFFGRFEWDYGRDPETVARQSAADMQTIQSAMAKLDEQRRAGKGFLQGVQDVRQFAGGPAFLDEHVYVLPPTPGKSYELLVLGDLHGCYTCLKAALLQADFFAKVNAYHEDPANNPDMKLVLLGDYIDRGRYSYNGILRTVLQLFLAVPDHVYVLRGNHEYYVELNGRVYGGVKPAEAINDLQDIAPKELFIGYMKLFDALPNMLLFDRTLFVHAGIPRDDVITAKWQGLHSLNDPEIRFQMLWSDPADTDMIPLELQKASARFPFGRRQFKSFMSRVGATTMIRGHERIIEGFKKVYDDGEYKLLNLFSAGGATNADLPESSNYREVTPMALTIKHRDGVSTLTPFVIDYARYNDPRYNAFFR